MDAAFLQNINKEYARLEHKRRELCSALIHPHFIMQSGWYNGHYHKDASGAWCEEYFPISVIRMVGLCDIEIGFEQLSVSTKLTRSASLKYSFEKFASYQWEAYGVQDYLLDFDHQGQSLDAMKEAIAASQEREIGISFAFPFDTDTKELYAFLMLLHQEGFFF